MIKIWHLTALVFEPVQFKEVSKSIALFDLATDPIAI